MFEIPKRLKPSMPPLTLIKKDDSNYGIDTEWTKIAIHIFKDQQHLNLPRFIWIKNSWTLKELHLNFYDEFKSIISNWYRDCKD